MTRLGPGAAPCNWVKVEETKLYIPADVAAVAAAVGAARAFAAAAALPPEPAARLAVVTEELVSNLIDHAAMPAGAMIELALVIIDDRVHLRLVDRAAPFDPRGATVAPIPDRGGGAGLALVRAWARIDSYTRDGDANVTRLSLPASG